MYSRRFLFGLRKCALAFSPHTHVHCCVFCFDMHTAYLYRSRRWSPQLGFVGVIARSGWIHILLGLPQLTWVSLGLFWLVLWSIVKGSLWHKPWNLICSALGRDLRNEPRLDSLLKCLYGWNTRKHFCLWPSLQSSWFHQILILLVNLKFFRQISGSARAV